MSAQKEIADILAQWLKLTQAEGAAIQAGNWPTVKQIQNQRAALRPTLTQAVKNDDGQKANPFQAQVGRIISLLNRNSALAAAKLQQAQAQRERIDQAKRTVDKIQHSYACPRSSAAWNSYS